MVDIDECARVVSRCVRAKYSMSDRTKAVVVIGNLAKAASANRRWLAEHKGVENVLACLEATADDAAKLRAASSRAMQHLARDRKVRRIILRTSGALKSIATLLEENGGADPAEDTTAETTPEDDGEDWLLPPPLNDDESKEGGGSAPLPPISESVRVAAKTRAAAANTLKQLGRLDELRIAINNTEAIPKLIKNLAFADSSKVRASAAAALWSLSQHPTNRREIGASARAIERLVDLLDDEDAPCREHAAGALGNLAHDKMCRRRMLDLDAVPLLVAMLGEEGGNSLEARDNAMVCLGLLDRHREGCLAVLCGRLWDTLVGR